MWQQLSINDWLEAQNSLLRPTSGVIQRYLSGLLAEKLVKNSVLSRVYKVYHLIKTANNVNIYNTWCESD